MEDQIALAEVKDKGLDHLEYADRGEFQIVEATKGGRTGKVRVELGKGNKIYRRVLRAWLALIMETRRGTEESPRGLCERSSSTRLVNNAKKRMRIEDEDGQRKNKWKNIPKDSGSMVRLECRREREVISAIVVNFSGIEVAQTLQGGILRKIG